MLVRQLEAMVPESYLATGELLGLAQFEDMVSLRHRPGVGMGISQLCGQVSMGARTVGHNHLVAAVGVLEKVIDPFLFHCAAGEVEVRFPILDTIVARLKGPLQFELHVQAGEYFLENLRNAFVLKDATLCASSQQP